jgi:hypothetical protein
MNLRRRDVFAYEKLYNFYRSIEEEAGRIGDLSRIKV